VPSREEATRHQFLVASRAFQVTPPSTEVLSRPFVLVKSPLMAAATSFVPSAEEATDSHRSGSAVVVTPLQPVPPSEEMASSS